MAVDAVDGMPEQAKGQKKVGFFSRFSRGRRSKRDVADKKREQTPSPASESPPSVVSTGDGGEDYKYPSRAGQVAIPPGARNSRLPKREHVPLQKPPTARESAFSGPPRYDWIDIVS
jgi:hypothetical protein